MKQILIILLFIRVGVTAQQMISKVVCSSNTHDPIELVNIHLLNTRKGTVSNLKGGFQVQMKEDSELEFSALGYESIRLGKDSLLAIDTVFMNAKRIELDEYKVYAKGMTGNDIVRIAMGKTSKLGYSKPYSMKAFYRHSCSEKDVYGRLIEAALTLHDNKGHKRRLENPSDKIGVEVNQIRRSFDFTENFDEHDPISIYSTLKYDLYSYTSFLHFYPEDFNFQLVDTSFYENSLVWVITYSYDKQREKSLQKDFIKCTGKLLIRASDFGILEISEVQNHTLRSEFEKHTYDLEWKVKYQTLNGKYFLKYIMEKGKNVDTMESTSHQIVSEKDHAFKVEIMVSDIQLEQLSRISAEEPSKTQLDEIQYDSIFWDNYTVIKNTPLEEKVVEDLERRQKLSLQFDK